MNENNHQFLCIIWPLLFQTGWNIKVIEDEIFLMFVLSSITKTKDQYYYIMLCILC